MILMYILFTAASFIFFFFFFPRLLLSASYAPVTTLFVSYTRLITNKRHRLG